MVSSFIPFLLFVQFPIAVFIYFDSKKRNIHNYWFWTLGVLLFMPFFLPFYVLLRPRKRFALCKSCWSKVYDETKVCSACGVEIPANEAMYGDWGAIDFFAILALSLFIIPMSIGGLGNSIGVIGHDWTEWGNMLFLSFVSEVSLVAMSVWFIRKVCNRPLSHIGLTSRNLTGNILLGVIAVLPSFLIQYVIEEAFIKMTTMLAPSQHEYIIQLQVQEHEASIRIFSESIGSLSRVSAVIFTVLLLAPIGEEILFRGILYTSLRQKKKLNISIIITSVIFAVAHAQLIHFLPVMSVGVILAYLYERTRSLVPSMTLHFVANLFLIVIWYYYPEFYT